MTEDRINLKNHKAPNRIQEGLIGKRPDDKGLASVEKGAAECSGRDFQRGTLGAHDWTRAAKAASRATAVLLAWDGPGTAPDADEEARATLVAFAQESREMGRAGAMLACDMLWTKALRSKAAMCGSKVVVGRVNNV